jgi:hypothetical protein
MMLSKLSLFRRFSRLWAGLAVVFAILLSCSAATAQTPAPSSLSSNRYLIILDTSRTMKPRVPGVVSTLSNLFEGTLAQQLRTGDTLGVWTFNSELVTGELPLQKWATNQQTTIRNQILRFASSRAYERKPDFGQVQLALDRVLQSSELLTAIVITSGEMPIQGTPFNEPINAILEQWQAELREQQKPIVVVLRGKSGSWTHHSVSPAPFPVELPPLPKVTVAEVATPKPAEPAAPKIPTNRPPQRVLPPLIVSGKSETTPLPVPSVAPETNPAPALIPSASPEPKPTTSQPSETSSAIPAPTMTPTPAVSQPPAGAPVVPNDKATTTAVSPASELSKAASPDTAAPQEKERVGAPGITAAAAAPEPRHGGKRLLFFVLAGAGLLLLLTVVVIWRWQRPHQPSLITRSLERKP